MKLKLLLLSACLALAACATTPTDPGTTTTEQKVAMACETATGAMDVVNAGTVAKRISLEDHAKALVAFKLTTPFCEPVVKSINDVDFARLLGAAATITTIKAGAK